MGTDASWRSYARSRLDDARPDTEPQLEEWPVANERAGEPVPWRQARNEKAHGDPAGVPRCTATRPWTGWRCVLPRAHSGEHLDWQEAGLPEPLDFL